MMYLFLQMPCHWLILARAAKLSRVDCPLTSLEEAHYQIKFFTQGWSIQVGERSPLDQVKEISFSQSNIAFLIFVTCYSNATTLYGVGFINQMKDATKKTICIKD